MRLPSIFVVFGAIFVALVWVKREFHRLPASLAQPDFANRIKSLTNSGKVMVSIYIKDISPTQNGWADS